MQEDKTLPGFQLADGQSYMLDRNYSAACRLNYQYYHWKESLQFNIHPSIPIPKHDARIADVGTGTAIWLLDLARDLPSAQLDGLDISLAQAPPKQWLPKNVNLRTWNAMNDVPSDLVGQYDLVHVRLLVLVVDNSDPRPMLRNLITLLKPGGYLQWDELDFRGTHVITADESVEAPALQDLRNTMYSDGRQDWALQLPEISSAEGLQDAELYRYEDRTELLRANCEQRLLVMDEYASRLVQIGKNEEASRLYRIIHDAYEETMRGAALVVPRIVCVAKKPQ